MPNDGKTRRRRRRGGGLLLTPLIDVIFLLVLFFVLNTSFRQDRFIDLNLPESETAEETQALGLVIVLRSDGSISIDEKEIPWESLTAEIIRLVEELDIEEVLLQGDQDVSYGTIVEVLDRIRMAGISAISLQSIAPNSKP